MADRPDGPGPGLLEGVDGRVRCAWAGSAREYLDYHDHEWGRLLRGDDAVFERLVLEGFQSGLSWITVLRKRPAFRAAFAGFRVAAVAAFTPADVERLLLDPGIVRNRAKIEAAVVNARAALALAEQDDGLSALAWSFAPTSGARPAPRVPAEVPATTRESVALARELKRRGFRFVGPTTAHALMQALGMVDDHLAGCWVRGAAGAPSSSAPLSARPGRASPPPVAVH